MIRKKQLPKRVIEILKIENHSKFLSKLKNKCEERNIKCKIVSEYLTTKICGNCFEKNEIGVKKEYTCNFCKILHERDVNAARNIYMLEILR